MRMPTIREIVRRSLPRKGFLVEIAKVVAVLAAFYAIQSQILGIRYDLYGSRSRVASAEERSSREIDEVQKGLETALREYAEDLSRTRRKLEASLEQLGEEREDLRAFLAECALDMEGSILSRLESERRDLDSTRSEVEAHAESLAMISAQLNRDPGRMKRKMILPTVQLRGNGTVGSGVLVYSRLQPDTAGPDGAVATTFVLTACHVVMEVLGDRFERGILDEVHLLLENEPDTTKVFSSKLMLFDRVKDIALLRLDTTELFSCAAEMVPAAEFRGIDVFTRAYAVGCPLGNRPLPTLGEISSKSKIVGDQVFWMLSAPTFFGNSGGGIYLAEDYRLIGISSMIYTYGKTNPAVVPHMGLFVPLDTICRWLDSEGYSFLYEQKPIPREMLWRLVYLEKGAPIPRAASGPPDQEP